MALLKVVNRKGKYHDPDSRETIARYITNPNKTLSGFIGVSEGVNPQDIAGSMNQVAQHFNKTRGVQLRHIIISFLPDEVSSPEVVYRIGCDLAGYTSQEYQTVFAVHENTNRLHIHLMFNSISFVDGHRYYGKKYEYYSFINHVKQVLHQYGIHRLYTVSSTSDEDVQVYRDDENNEIFIEINPNKDYELSITPGEREFGLNITERDHEEDADVIFN